jgi:NAD(P)H-flavin reductase
VGIPVKLTAPLGKFVSHGGIGVIPSRSIIKYATNKQLPVRIILFNANRNQDNILYKEEFDECANSNKI